MRRVSFANQAAIIQQFQHDLLFALDPGVPGALPLRGICDEAGIERAFGP